MDDEGTRVVNMVKASELKKEFDDIDKRYSVEHFGKYLETIPVSIDQHKLLEAEKEWFEENVNKSRWLEKAKIGILNKDDFQDISGKQFIKKSGVKKLANAFHISVSIISVEEIMHDWGTTPQYITKTVNGKEYKTLALPAGKELIIKVKARAERKVMITDKQTGKTYDIVADVVEEVGACSNIELAQKKGQGYNYHVISSTASTRATNRAVLNCIGGSVSAEEMDLDRSE